MYGLRKHKRKQEKLRTFLAKDNNIENKDMENADGNKIVVSDVDNSTDYINFKKRFLYTISKKIKDIDMYKNNDSKWKKYTYAKVTKITGYPRTFIMEWVSQAKF